MRLRFIKPLHKNRILLRGPFTEDMLVVSSLIIDLGYNPATLVQFWSHVLFWKWRKKKAEKAQAPPKKK